MKIGVEGIPTTIDVCSPYAETSSDHDHMECSFRMFADVLRSSKPEIKRNTGICSTIFTLRKVNVQAQTICTTL